VNLTLYITAFSINSHGSQTTYNMASAPRKAPASSQAEVALLPSLKNCLLNLPTSLVNVLLNSNAVVQNVVVELSFKSAAGSDGKPGKQQSVFLGWTGMRSQTGPRQEQEVAGVEVDATFGRLLGLKDGMKVRCLNC
jgi:peroxin-1